MWLYTNMQTYIRSDNESPFFLLFLLAQNNTDSDDRKNVGNRPDSLISQSSFITKEMHLDFHC